VFVGAVAGNADSACVPRHFASNRLGTAATISHLCGLHVHALLRDSQLQTNAIEGLNTSGVGIELGPASTRISVITEVDLAKI